MRAVLDMWIYVRMHKATILPHLRRCESIHLRSVTVSNIYLFTQKRAGILSVQNPGATSALSEVLRRKSHELSVRYVVMVAQASFVRIKSQPCFIKRINYLTVTPVMCGFTPSYQYRKPSISTLSPTFKFFTAL